MYSPSSLSFLLIFCVQGGDLALILHICSLSNRPPLRSLTVQHPMLQEQHVGEISKALSACGGREGGTSLPTDPISIAKALSAYGGKEGGASPDSTASVSKGSNDLISKGLQSNDMRTLRVLRWPKMKGWQLERELSDETDLLTVICSE